MKRLMSLFTLSAFLLIATVSVASAGGWAVVTLDAIPTGLVVDTPVTVGMMVRQHGITPMAGGYVKVRWFQPTGDSFEVYARDDKKGHYSADLTFNRPGTWNWQVASGLMPEWQSMPTLEVANSVEDEVLLAKANTASEVTQPNLQTMAPSMMLLAVGVLGFALCAGGLVYWLRARNLG